MPSPKHRSLTSRALRLAVLRIGVVSVLAGAISYYVNHATIEDAVREQLVLSTEQTLQRESLPFKEIKELQRNFLDEFKEVYSRPEMSPKLAHDFDQIFYRHPDGSYTQRPGLFEGMALADGRRFAGTSATYAPDFPPSADIKKRFALSYQLSYKYGSSVKGRVFNFYGVVPEKGFPIYQAADIAKVFTYSGPEALKLETYEFYSRGFGSPSNDTLFTRMYWDFSNEAWMTTVATPDVADASGKHRILACTDVLLDELMRRLAHPSITGSYGTAFLADDDGTLIYHPAFLDQIKHSAGVASIKSLKLEDGATLLHAGRNLVSGKATLVDTANELVAIGRIPETPWLLTVHYPKALMQPAILQNLAIVVMLALITLLVEVFILRSILQKQVAIPLSRLMRATRQVGLSSEHLDSETLPIHSEDEIGELARDFANMANRVEEAHDQLEHTVQERTAALEAANRKLTTMSETDGLTGIANRRRFDEVLASEWNRAKRAGSALTLAMIDVDWFKKYNDRYGHQAGDDCLKNVARILEAHARRGGDLVARYGGEEFAFIAPATNAAYALKFAQRLCAAMEAAALPYESSLFGCVTISVGVATVAPQEDGASMEALLKQADEALYRAKKQGRNQAVLAEAAAAE